MPYYRCPECGLTTHSVAGHSSAGMCASCAAPVPFEARLHPAMAHGRIRAQGTGLAGDDGPNGALRLEGGVAQ